MTMADVIDLQAWKGRLSSSKQGYKKNMTNLMMFLKNVKELGNTIRWNEFSQRIEWNGHPLEDHNLVDIRLILEAQDYDAADKDIMPAIIRHARENAYHPVRDYLRALKWDGTERLDHWLNLCLGAPKSAFIRTIGRKTLISAVARAFKPGCKVDTMLVLEGPQGLKKSSAISALFGDAWTAESVNLFDQHNKMVMQMMGAWCVELAEFVAIQRKDQNSVKGMISMKSDRVVLSYAKIATDHPRQCIFVGTINPDNFGYLTDNTGNRRYWPVRCTKIELGLIRERRDQLWAEAVRAFHAGEQWWLTDGEEALASTQVAQREEADIWEEVLGSKIAEHEKANAKIESLSIARALQFIGVPNERMGKIERNRVANVLRKLGWTQDPSPRKDENRRSIRVFLPPE
jgi:predicted P-loop ATPase